MTRHLAQTAAIDFFIAPAATFRIFFVLVVLSHHLRLLLHFGLNEHPRHERTMQHATAKMQRESNENWVPTRFPYKTLRVTATVV